MGKRTGARNDWGRPAAPTPAREHRENGGRTSSAEKPDSLEEEIRLRAYYRYLEREPEDGDATADPSFAGLWATWRLTTIVLAGVLAGFLGTLTAAKYVGPSLKAAGGAAYGPALTDVVILGPEGRIFVTGPDVVRSLTGEDERRDARSRSDHQYRQRSTKATRHVARSSASASAAQVTCRDAHAGLCPQLSAAQSFEKSSSRGPAEKISSPVSVS